MTTKTNIANMAIGHLGIGKDIGNVETELSQEAAAVRRYYDVALAFVLRSWYWPFAKSYATLALVEEDPSLSWSYSFRYPADCLDIRYVGSAPTVRLSSASMIGNFEIGSDTTGKLIFCNDEAPTIEYTRLVTQSVIYPPDFILSLSAYLAFLIAPRLTSADSGLAMAALGLFDRFMGAAKSNAYNEENRGAQSPESEFITVREGGAWNDGREW